MQEKSNKALIKIRQLCLLLAAAVIILSILSLLTRKHFLQDCAFGIAISGLAIVTFLTSQIVNSGKK